MQRRAIEDLARLVGDRLAEAEIPRRSVQCYVTPRRLTIIADGIPGQQPDEARTAGPRVGAPQQAIDGFLRAAGIGKIDECEIRDTGRGEFYFAVVERPGRPATAILPELLRAAIGELPWPKSMRYPAASLRWVRPLVSVVSLFDGAVLPLALDRIPVGRATRGQSLSVEARSPSRMRPTTRETRSFLCDPRPRPPARPDRRRSRPPRRRRGPRRQARPGAARRGRRLVEFPAVLIGAIDEASMELPPRC